MYLLLMFGELCSEIQKKFLTYDEPIYIFFPLFVCL